MVHLLWSLGAIEHVRKLRPSSGFAMHHRHSIRDLRLKRPVAHLSPGRPPSACVATNTRGGRESGPSAPILDVGNPQALQALEQALQAREVFAAANEGCPCSGQVVVRGVVDRADCLDRCDVPARRQLERLGLLGRQTECLNQQMHARPLRSLSPRSRSLIARSLNPALSASIACVSRR